MLKFISINSAISELTVKQQTELLVTACLLSFPLIPWACFSVWCLWRETWRGVVVFWVQQRGKSRGSFWAQRKWPYCCPRLIWARIPSMCGDREPFSDFQTLCLECRSFPGCSCVEGLVSCYGLRWWIHPESSDLISGLTHWWKGMVRRSESGESRWCLQEEGFWG